MLAFEQGGNVLRTEWFRSDACTGKRIAVKCDVCSWEWSAVVYVGQIRVGRLDGLFSGAVGKQNLFRRRTGTRVHVLHVLQARERRLPE